ncbi:MAG: adenylate/guanylate cyclase domain-containing protein [Acidimicrobiales bacterium]
MAKLSASERKKLPDSAFAYVDAAGTRRLPINDESHVRNALSRFGQVAFETDEARETARRRLLNAAKKHGIVPVGFIDGELRVATRKSAAGRLIIELGRVDSSAALEAELQRTLDDPALLLLRWAKQEGTYVGCAGQPVALPNENGDRQATFLQGRGRPLMAVVHARDAFDSPELTEAVMAAVHLVAGREMLDEIDDMGVATEGLPDGDVTFLLTDIEGSTALLNVLGDTYAAVLADVRAHIRSAVLETGGRQVEARADEFVAVFESPDAAVDAAIVMQQRLGDHGWPDEARVRVRAGIHSGNIALTEAGYVGLTVHAAARIMAASHGGQIVVSSDTSARCEPASGRRFRSLGTHRLRGLVEDHELLQVEAPGLLTDFPPPAV